MGLLPLYFVPSVYTALRLPACQQPSAATSVHCVTVTIITSTVLLYAKGESLCMHRDTKVAMPGSKMQRVQNFTQILTCALHQMAGCQECVHQQALRNIVGNNADTSHTCQYNKRVTAKPRVTCSSTMCCKYCSVQCR